MSDLGAVATAWMDAWFDAAAGLLWNPVGSYEELGPARSLHLVPQSVWYAAGLLVRVAPGDVDRAAQVIEAVCDLQYDEPGAVWHGTFARFAETPRPAPGARIWVDYDPNWRQFVGTTFVLVLRSFPGVLPPETEARMHQALRLAVDGEPRDRVEPSYTNIALMKAWLETECASRFDRPELQSSGEALAAAVVERFERFGAFDEYNSPTYYGMDLYALALWRSGPNARLRAWGEDLERRLWLDVARWYHAGLRNLAGPYSRSYGMDLESYASMLALWMWEGAGPDVAPFPDVDAPFDHSHDFCLSPCIALLGARIPRETLTVLRSFPGEHTVEQVLSTSPDRVATGWLSKSVMTGGEASDVDWGGWYQYHPGTIHWQRQEGPVGWVKVSHRGPVDARAVPGGLDLVAGVSAHRGPQGARFLVDGGVGPDAVTAGRWALSGIDVAVETSCELAHVQEKGQLLEIAYAPGDGVFRLRVMPTDG